MPALVRDRDLESANATMVLVLLIGFAVNSADNLMTGLFPAVVGAVALQTVRGLGIAAMDIGSNTLIQRLVPTRLLGRVFGNLYGGIGIAAGLSSVLGGLVLDATSAPITLILAGTGGLAAAVLAALTLPRALRFRTDPDPREDAPT